MILNVIFLVGGICIGYLIRGEMDRRKSKKMMSVVLDEGIKVAEKIINAMEEKNEDGDYEIDGPEEISFDDLSNIFKEVTDSSNSNDETIKL